jgi:acyl carrier protein
MMTPSKEAVLLRLQRLAAQVLSLDLTEAELRALTRLDEVSGLDSLNVVEFVVGVEREFGIRFEAADIERAAIADLPALAGRIVRRLAAPC